MRILHVSTSLGIGGAELMLQRLLLSDPELQKRAVIVSLTDLGEIGRSLREKGFSVHALNMHGFWSLLVAFFRLVRLVRRYKPEIVQTWMYHADLLGGLAARFVGCRNVIWGVRSTCVPIGRPVTFLIMRVCAVLSYILPARIVCVAEAARLAHASYGYCSDKMYVIPNGFVFDRFNPAKIDHVSARKSLGINSDAIIIGCLGRFHLDKGQDVFVQAASKVVEQYPDVRFLLVGRGCNSVNQALVDQIRGLCLQNHFLLMGERSDVPECLAAMDVFCMPSRTEGFPNGLGEAMAMGLPCVATLVGDTEVLTADTVRLVEPESPEAMVVGLLEVLSLTNEQRMAMGRRAAERVRIEFSIDKARERFYAVYQEVLEFVP